MQAGSIYFAQRYRPAMPGRGATGASAAGVPLTGIRIGGSARFSWFDMRPHLE